MPADHAARSDDDVDLHAFADAPPRIVQILDKAVVFPSLQRPKRIELLASNGQHYFLLCKKDDDLRKDARVVELNALINRLLQQSAEARRRDLYVRTYNVVPLSELTGLLEWVGNTVPLRTALVDIYKKDNIVSENFVYFVVVVVVCEFNLLSS